MKLIASSLASLDSWHVVVFCASDSVFNIGVVDCSTMVSVEFVFEDESAVVVWVSFVSSSSFVSIRGRRVGVVELGLFSGVGGALSALELGGGDGVGRRFEDVQLGDADVL